jgi:hypothetical protein
MSIDEKNKSSDFKRLYRGAYEYFSNGNNYMEEKFEVFKEKKTLENHYEAELLTRVSTGEVLKVLVSYVINKEWIPQSVMITRTLGNNYVKERFTYTQRRNSLRYSYESPHNKKDEVIITPPKFTIQTPSTACSMTFISSKKIDQTAENFYYTFVSPNGSIYKDNIYNKNIIVKRAKLGELTNIKIGEASVSSTEYIVYDDQNENSKQKMHIFVSKHLMIPYKLVMDSENYIQIKYLNDFTDSDTEDDQPLI